MSQAHHAVEEVHSPSRFEDRIKKVGKSAKEDLKTLTDTTGKLVLLDFVVGFMLIFAGITFAGLPLGTLAVLGLVLLRVQKKPQFTVPYAGLFTAVMVVALAYVTTASILWGVSTPDQTLRRVFRICIILLLALFIAERRIDLKSILFGTSLGMLVNTVAYYAGIAPDNYHGYLTGWLGDKNVSGLYHAIIPLLLFFFLKKNSHRLILLIIALPLLWLTGSRTSIAAFMIGVIWFLFAYRLNLFLKLFLGAFVAWFFNWLQDNFADSSLFGDRTGTDWFREQIDTASLAKLESAPWHGLGMGQATVELDSGTFFFHNSFWTLLVEGGWPLTPGSWAVSSTTTSSLTPRTLQTFLIPTTPSSAWISPTPCWQLTSLRCPYLKR